MKGFFYLLCLSWSLFFIPSTIASTPTLEGFFELRYKDNFNGSRRVFDRISLNHEGVVSSYFMRERSPIDDPTTNIGAFCKGVYHWQLGILSVEYHGPLEWGKICPHFSFTVNLETTDIALLNVGDAAVSGSVRSQRFFNASRDITIVRLK